MPRIRSMRRLLIAWLLVGCNVAAAAPPAGDWRGDLCHGDDGCRWDDPCKPTRCVGARGAAPPAAGCDESAPPPGTCRCVEEMCTLRPGDPAYATSDGTCRRDDECAIDVAAGTCHAGGETLIGPIHQ